MLILSVSGSCGFRTRPAYLEVTDCDLKIGPGTVAKAPTFDLDDTSAPRILDIRGEKVIIDRDVARLFGVETKVFNQQVKRNEGKFGTDFAFRLTEDEFASLRSQLVTSSGGWGGARYLPLVFTEHGVVMAATILHSKRAAQATRFIVKVFVQARRQAADQNLPVVLHPRATVTIAAEMRQSLMGKINDALGHVLDAIVDQKTNRTVREEALDVANEGIKSLKEYLKRAGIQNDKSLAEIRKLMAEAESIEVGTAGKRTENEMKQLALLAKKLRLVLEAQQFAETGSVEGLLQVLKDFDNA